MNNFVKGGEVVAPPTRKQGGGGTPQPVNLKSVKTAFSCQKNALLRQNSVYVKIKVSTTVRKRGRGGGAPLLAPVGGC